MHKILLATVASIALAGAAEAGSRGGNRHVTNTGTASSNFDFTKTRSVTNTRINENSWQNYNGFQGFTAAEHGGLAKTQTNGKAVGLGASVNYSKGTFNGGELNGSLNASLGISGLNGSLSGSAAIRGLTAGSESVSGSLAVAGSAGAGSSKVETAGYAAGGAGARNEWGGFTTSIYEHNRTTVNQWTGSRSSTYGR